jgi:DNA-binding transcriptional LysR family regulator
LPSKAIFIIFSLMKDSLKSLVQRLTLKQLRAVAAIAEAGTISGAAARLGLTPPALLQQLKLLEETLRVPLLERRAGLAVPTEAGREVLAAIAQIEGVLGDCVEAITALRNNESGQVAVAVISTAKYFAPAALAAFQRSHPNIELRLQVANRRDTIAALQQYEVDFALMGRPPQDFPVMAAAFGEHPHVIIAPCDHPFARVPRIPLSALKNETFLSREKGSGTRVLEQKLFTEAGVTPKASIELGSNETIKQAVIAGMGVALLSAHTIAAEYASHRLAILDVVGTPIVRQWFVVKRQEKRLLPAAQSLWDHFVREGRTFLPDIKLAVPLSPAPSAD